MSFSHILVFSLAYDPYWGGAEIALREIMQRLPQFRFTVITARALKNFPVQPLKEIEEQGNVRVVRVGPTNRWRGQYGYPFAAVRRAFTEARFQKPDAVWGMMESYGGMAAALYHQEFPHIPYLLTMQSGDSERFWALRTWFWRPWYKKVFVNAAAVQAISTPLAARAKALGARGIIEVVPNGVAGEDFAVSVTPEERHALRAQWGLGGEGVVVMTASRLVEKNGIDTLIKGYAEWRRKYSQPHARLVIAGRGLLGGELQKLARKEKMGAEVRFLGEIPYYELPRYYQAADLFVRPSRSEGLGSAFLEAMASGLPVIGTPVGGIPDFLKEGITGLLIPPDKPRHLADALERLVNDPALRARLIAQGRAMVHEHYSWDYVAERVGMLIERLIPAQK